MWPDWVSNPGPLALESDALPTQSIRTKTFCYIFLLLAKVLVRSVKKCISNSLNLRTTTLHMGVRCE